MKPFSSLAVLLATSFCFISTTSPFVPDSSTTQAPPKNATYWVTMSSSVRPGQRLELNVQILVGNDPVAVSVSLRTSDGNKTLSKTLTSNVMPGEAQNIFLDVPENIKTLSGEEYLYNLKALVIGEGRSVKFKEEVYLTFYEKAFSVFVQTDKAMYKAGQLVKFRVLAMTPDLKVIRDNLYDIIIKDSKDNKIKQWLRVQDPNQRGVLELSLQLANSIPTGDWSIIVKTKETEASKTFTVENYVLPRFEVTIISPPFGVVYDPILPITVQAKYTFGQPVTNGKVDVIIKFSYFYNTVISQPQIKVSGQLNKDGEYSLQVSSKQLLQLASQSVTYTISELTYQQFDISANVTEADTERVQQSTNKITFYSNPLLLSFLEISPSNFKPGLDYTGYIEVKKQDSTLFTPEELNDFRIHINITYDVKLSKEELDVLQKKLNISTTNDNNSSSDMKMAIFRPYIPYSQTKTLVLNIDNPIKRVPDNGLLPISFKVPLEAESAAIIATCLQPFKDVTAYRYINKMNSPTSTYLQLIAPTERPKVGSVVTIKAEATEILKKLNCQVYSKGKLLLSDTLSSNSGSKLMNFSFNVSQAMTPKLSVVCFFMKEENSEFVVDGLSMSVDGLFQKPVTVEFSKKQVKPGEDVDVIVKAEADSMIYLLAVDKSVKLLKSGNDITQDLVQDELMTYDYGGFNSYWRYMFFCGWPSYFGGTDAETVFNNAGVKVITDGIVFRQPYSGRPIFYAAPMATNDFKSSSSSSGFLAAETVRKYFPENWIWESVLTDAGGQVTLSVKSPDTITTWILTAFSTHPEFGLSVAKESANLTTFRKLFVSVDLPISIIRNEVFCFTVSTFSYYEDEIPVLLTLDKSDYFSNIHVKLQDGQVVLSKESLYYSYFLGYLQTNDIVNSKFCFTSNFIGDIPLKVSALTNVPGLSDAMELNITIKPEGVPRTKSFPFLVDLSGGNWSKTIPFSFPSSAVPDSESVTVNIAGNILGPMMDNLDDLLKKPYGCGEQNMLNFAPVVYFLEFQLSTSTNSSEKIDRAKDYMLIGYQKEITYEHAKTGGFSAFGSQDGTPSLWLTAFVLRCFGRAIQLDDTYGNIITVDSDIISRSAHWIITQQNSNGSFTEHGKVFHKEMQGGSSEGEALTAYTIIALYEARKAFKGNESAAQQIDNSITLAKNFLISRLSSLQDPYDICIVTFTLHLINDQNKETAFSKMESIAITGDGLKYWKRSKPVGTDAMYEWSASADSISIEMTAYALLTHSLRGTSATNGLPILRWLTHNKGPNGGFISTQDTVTGLQALSSVAIKGYRKEENALTFTVSYTINGQKKTEMVKINKSNEMLLQSFTIDYKNGEPTAVDIVANTDNGLAGPNTVIAEVVLGFNVKDETKSQFYDLTHTLVELAKGFQLTISIKTSQANSSSMTMLEVDIPPGYSTDKDSLKANPNISLVEVKGDKLLIYFDADIVNSKGIVVEIFMASTGGVLVKSQPRMYRVYNYYDPSIETTKVYTLAESDFCTKVPTLGACQYKNV